jgi:hypothetical protein
MSASDLVIEETAGVSSLPPESLLAPTPSASPVSRTRPSGASSKSPNQATLTAMAPRAEGLDTPKILRVSQSTGPQSFSQVLTHE